MQGRMSTRRRISSILIYIFDISPIYVDKVCSGNDDAETASLVEELHIGLVKRMSCATNEKTYQHEL